MDGLKNVFCGVARILVWLLSISLSLFFKVEFVIYLYIPSFYALYVLLSSFWFGCVYVRSGSNSNPCSYSNREQP
jgi:hypothetical protein